MASDSTTPCSCRPMSASRSRSGEANDALSSVVLGAHVIQSGFLKMQVRAQGKLTLCIVL
eukprot:4836-Heterococcus_DN1.PRE.2